MPRIRWNILVSPETDTSLRIYLQSQGQLNPVDFAHFVEEAVRAQLFDMAATHVKTANADMSESDIDAIVEEAVQWAREPDARRA